MFLKKKTYKDIILVKLQKQQFFTLFKQQIDQINNQWIKKNNFFLVDKSLTQVFVCQSTTEEETDFAWGFVSNHDHDFI